MCLGSGVAELPGCIRLRHPDITDIIMIRPQPGLRCVSPVADQQIREATSSRMAGIFFEYRSMYFFFFSNVKHVKTDWQLNSEGTEAMNFATRAAVRDNLIILPSLTRGVFLRPTKSQLMINLSLSGGRASLGRGEGGRRSRQF